MIVAVGDIHAYSDKLHDLLATLHEKVDFEAEDTKFVFLGDYVDGGPDASGVLSLLMNIQADRPDWVFLMGNHEDLLLSALGYPTRAPILMRGSGDYYLWYNQGGKETLESYMSTEENQMTDYEKAIAQPKDFLPDFHLAWLNSLPLSYESDKFIFVHAGLTPRKTVDETLDDHKLWIRGPFINSDYDWGKKVIFGHTYQPHGPLVMPNKIGIDTMHHGGGRLTAAILDDTLGEVVEFVQSFE